MLAPQHTKEINTDAQRELSERLDAYHRQDFRPADAALRKLYPRSQSRMVRKPLALVYRYVMETADAYARAPERTFLTGDGQPMEATRAQELLRWYGRLNMEEAFQLGNELLAVQRTYIGAILPRPMGGYRHQVWRPYQYEVTPHPDDPGSLSSAKEVRLAVPVETDRNRVRFGLLVMNQERIYIKDGREERPVFFGSTQNPFAGRLPLWYGREGSPLDGEFNAAVPDDLDAAQTAMCLEPSESNLIGRSQSFGQRTLSGGSRVKPQEMELGPELILPLEDGEILANVQPSPTLGQYLDAGDRYLRLFFQLRGINADSVLKGAMTWLAKQMDLADRERFKVRMRRALEAAEARFLQALVTVLNKGAVRMWPTDLHVTVGWREQAWPADPQNEAAAAETLQRIGVESGPEQIARRRQITIEEATRVYQANMTLARAARAAAPSSP
ncbi:MAG: hypothetical protein AMXMBFR64_05010 [Myxococcales bacterium]